MTVRKALGGPRRVALVTAFVLVVLAPSARAAEDEDDACDRPAITLLRYDEDYAFLKDPRCRTDLWDPIKYVALAPELPAYLTFGLDVRERFELFAPPPWEPEPAPRVGYLLQRVMPYADVHAGPHLRAFLQLTSNLVWGRDPRPVDRDDLDLLQAFAEVSFGPVAVRAGRQEVQYASSRLVSIREGPNVRQAFDGLRILTSIRTWELDGFAFVPVQVRPGVFDDRPEPGQGFWGTYATGPLLAEWAGLDVYYLGRLREGAAFEQGTAREVRHTIGVRLWGEPARFDYNVELAYQLGTFGAGGIAAWMVASDLGYTFEALPTGPRLGLQANVVSGDASPLGRDLQTFNPLFPRGAYFSQASLIGPLNLMDVHPGLTLKPLEGLELTLDWDFFWRQRLGDGLYQPSTALQLAGAGNPARFVGSQGQAQAVWKANRHLELGAAYSHLFAGPFLRLAGVARDIDFLTVWISHAI